MPGKKSFLKILGLAVSTFKSSFWGIILTYCFSVPIAFIFIYIITHIFHIPLGHSAHISNSLHLSPSMAVLAITITILFIYGGILLQTWQTLVIKNNMFTGLNNLAEAFKKSFLKSLKVCLLLIIFTPAFVWINILAVKVFPACINFLSLLFIPFLPLIMIFLGIVLQDVKFTNALINSAALCITYYFRILGYTILILILPIIATILIRLLMIIPLFWFIAIILLIFLQFMATPFFICFFAELYFDLVSDGEEKPLEDLTELSQSYPNVVDINQQAEQKSSAEMPQEQQEIHEKVPEGLQELGGNYEDKK